MGEYTKKDASEDTGDSTSKVSEAWHGARDDAAGSGDLPERNANKVSDSEDGPELAKVFDDAGMVPKK